MNTTGKKFCLSAACLFLLMQPMPIATIQQFFPIKALNSQLGQLASNSLSTVLENNPDYLKRGLAILLGGLVGTIVLIKLSGSKTSDYSQIIERAQNLNQNLSSKYKKILAEINNLQQAPDAEISTALFDSIRDEYRILHAARYLTIKYPEHDYCQKLSEDLENLKSVSDRLENCLGAIQDETLKQCCQEQANTTKALFNNLTDLAKLIKNTPVYQDQERMQAAEAQKTTA